jgi:GAF domain-containing protein
MPAAPLPRDEKKRLRELAGLNILDSAPEDFSNALATAAASIANTPLAAISLVDADRQWFKGSVGLRVRETSREVSFCAHAVADSGQPLIVHDAACDERFRDNALVLGEPHIRFYAGFPLRVNGRAVGALCVFDDRPRVLSDTQINRLADLAEGTVAWMLHRLKRLG